MVRGRTLYSGEKYDTTEKPREDRPRKRRASRSRSPDRDATMPDHDDIPPPPSQPARNYRVDRRANNPQREVSRREYEEANVGGRRQSRDRSPPAQGAHGARREYSYVVDLREYREHDPNPWRTNDNQAPDGRQTPSRPNHDTRSLADHILRSYPDWMKQSEIEKEYTAVDTMIELFRNDQRARQPMLNDRSGTTSMTRRRYEGLLGTWRNANPPPDMSSIIEANTARMRNEGREGQGFLGNDLPPPRESAQRMVNPDMASRNSVPNLARNARAPGPSTTPLTPPRAVPANYRSQPPDLGSFVGRGSYPPIARSAGSSGGRVIAEPQVAYTFPHRNGPIPPHQLQEQGPVSRRNEEFRNIPTGLRNFRPLAFRRRRAYGLSRSPSPRRQATVEEAPEPVAFNASRRLQQADRDIRDEPIRPSPVFDHDEGELPDSQGAW